MNQYQKDYELSRKEELRFEKYMQEKYKLSTENTDPSVYFPYWDIRVTAHTKNDKVTTFEVKYNNDYKEPKVVIELCQFVNGEKVDTGLSKTISDYYIMTFKDDNNFYLIKTDKIREFADIKNKEYSGKRTIFQDRNNYLLVSFDKEWFLKHTRII